jgi:ribosomal protein S18 acetylase RimI-like enzyme
MLHHWVGKNARSAKEREPMKKQKPIYQIQTACTHDIRNIYDMARREGWNPGLSDADAAAVGMPDTFMVGVLDGEIIASIAATQYNNDLGYVSFYLVKPEYRGRGYGVSLWQAAMKRLTHRNIVLDAMITQTKLYEKLGFRIDYEFCSYHFDGGMMAMPLNKQSLQQLQGETLEKVLAYDRAFFPANRSWYMRQWLMQANAHGFAWQEEDRVQGYGMIRRAEHGFRIGPCYSDNKNIARHLFQALLAQANGAEVSISMPEDNPLARCLVRDFDLKPGSRLQRMSTKSRLDLPLERILAITNFTFG